MNLVSGREKNIIISSRTRSRGGAQPLGDTVNPAKKAASVDVAYDSSSAVKSSPVAAALRGRAATDSMLCNVSFVR
jgi:hypothetical protein